MPQTTPLAGGTGTPYITNSDLNMPDDLLIQLTDDEGTGAVNQPRVDDAILKAEALIDSYCGKRYLVPFTAAPIIVKDLAATIARYKLYSRRALVSDDMAALYKDAVKTLTDISLGKASLGVDPIPQGSSEVGGVISGPERIFGRDKMGGF